MIQLKHVIDVTDFLGVKEEDMLVEFCRYKQRRIEDYLHNHHEYTFKDVPRADLRKLSGMALIDTFNHYSSEILRGVYDG